MSLKASSDSSPLPPRVSESDRIIMFDGVCKLCNAWSNFILDKDRARHFKLCSVQSQAGQDILRWYQMPTETFDTMLYLEGAQVYKKSEAFLRIIAHIPGAWAWLRHLRVIPTSLRDWCYDRIALNRYRLFGKYNMCVMPTQENMDRFLDAD